MWVVGPQESCQLVIHGLLSWPLIDDGIGQGFQYEGLVARQVEVVAVALLLCSGSLPVL